MDEYPDFEDEYNPFDNDEYEAMMEQDYPQGPTTPTPTTSQSSRKSSKKLDFDNMSSQRETQLFNETSTLPISSLNNAEGSQKNKPIKSKVLYETPELFSEEQDEILTTLNLDVNSKKRNIEELFGDINDIEIEDTLNRKRKKSKSVGDPDLELIEIIKQKRERIKEENTLTSYFNKKHSSFTSEYIIKNNISTSVPKWPFIPVCKGNGERLYVRFHSEEYFQEEINRIATKSKYVGVLGASFKDTWKRAEKYLNEKKQLQNNAAPTEKNNTIEVSLNDDSNQLWVELYKPRKYMELLSDDCTNRTLLEWIKMWDKVVFNRERKRPLRKIDPKTQVKTKFNQKMNPMLDEHGRPQQKIALLCGPPGLGKTTLAHIVARHCGYNVVEINASDDRSTDAFKIALENATQMKSVLDTDKRPNCLILDEIDGAPATTIDYLIKFINGMLRPKTKRGEKAKAVLLKRPLICICNDMYVPALRALRQIAFIINFPQTASSRLAERLMQIARYQKVKTDLSAMLALSEKTQNDIRACLSVLHFYKSQKKPVKLFDIYKSSIGQKDMHKSLFQVWQEIFLIHRPKHNVTNIENESVYNITNLKCRMKRVLDIIQSCGDYDRLIQGVFENYPNMMYRDSSLEGTCESLEWFVFTDLLNRSIYGEQNFVLFPYLYYAFVMWHFVFGSLTWQKLTYPSAGYEAHVKQGQTQAMLSEILRAMHPSVRAYSHREELLLDTAPLLNEIILPIIKPGNISFFTQRERNDLNQVVNIMIDYNLTYVQERFPNGTYGFLLEPNIEKLAYFKTNKPTKVIPMVEKQLISREIESEKLRRNENSLRKESALADNKKKTDEAKVVQKTMNAKPSTADKAALPNHLQKLQPKRVQENVVLKKDFFGRTVEVQPNGNNKGGFKGGVNTEVWFYHKAGYNNAVRKNITMQYLL